VGRDVAHGSALVPALRRHEAVFDGLALELIAAGEESGGLEPAIAQLVEHLERLRKLRLQALLGAIYPAYLVATLTLVGPLLELSGAVRGGETSGGLVGVYLGGVLRNLVALGLLGSIVFALPLLVAALGVEPAWERLKLSIPGARAATRGVLGFRFHLALGLALRAGLDVYRALRLAVATTSSPLLAARLGAAERRIRSGRTLTDAIEVLGLFDRVTLGELAVAEQTGTLDATLERLTREAEEAALRALRLLLVALLALTVAVLLGVLVLKALEVVFGPILDYFRTVGTL
jgi:type II secretory pathway component PulF